jgi:predicted RNA-binding protein
MAAKSGSLLFLGVIVLCEANAYLREGDLEELFLESVDKVIPLEEGLVLEDIFGRRKIIKAKIAELALVDHKIILEKV